MGRNQHDLQAVYVMQLSGFGVGGARHPGQTLIHAEIILKGDGGHGLVFTLDGDSLLGFNRLMQTVRPAPPRHCAPGKLINNDNFALLDDVVHVFLEKRVSAQSRADVMQQVDVGRIVKAAARLQKAGLSQYLFAGVMPLFGQINLLALLVHRVVAILPILIRGLKLLDILIDRLIDLWIALAGAGNNQGCARLINQDGVHLINQPIAVAALNFVFPGQSHVVAQIVKAELVVGAVCDISLISGLPLLRFLLADDNADAETQGPVNGSHPFGIPPSQVIIHRYDVDGPTGQGVQVGGQSGHQGFSLTR